MKEAREAASAAGLPAAQRCQVHSDTGLTVDAPATSSCSGATVKVHPKVRWAPCNRMLRDVSCVGRSLQVDQSAMYGQVHLVLESGFFGWFL